MSVDKAIGQLLKDAREDLELTQSDLSKKVHMPQYKISRVENGRISLKVYEIKIFAEALGKVFVFAFVPKDK
jgi:predicted transcriptional regulator